MNKLQFITISLRFGLLASSDAIDCLELAVNPYEK